MKYFDDMGNERTAYVLGLEKKIAQLETELKRGSAVSQIVTDVTVEPEKKTKKEKKQKNALQ